MPSALLQSSRPPWGWAPADWLIRIGPRGEGKGDTRNPEGQATPVIISIGFPAESPARARRELGELVFTDRYGKGNGSSTAALRVLLPPTFYLLARATIAGLVPLFLGIGLLVSYNFIIKRAKSTTTTTEFGLRIYIGSRVGTGFWNKS